MQCACGVKSPNDKSSGITVLNKHRRTCAAFWQSIYNEMERIAVDIYGRPVPISQRDWNRFKSSDLPSWEMMRKWSPPWSEIQEKAGFGQSSRGVGAVSYCPVDMDAIASSIVPMTTTVESYLAQTYREGLTICEQSFIETGRMWVR
jgi:hypothetical protein